MEAMWDMIRLFCWGSIMTFPQVPGVFISRRSITVHCQGQSLTWFQGPFVLGVVLMPNFLGSLSLCHPCLLHSWLLTWIQPS